MGLINKCLITISTIFDNPFIDGITHYESFFTIETLATFTFFFRYLGFRCSSHVAPRLRSRDASGRAWRKWLCPLLQILPRCAAFAWIGRLGAVWETLLQPGAIEFADQPDIDAPANLANPARDIRDASWNGVSSWHEHVFVFHAYRCDDDPQASFIFQMFHVWNMYQHLHTFTTEIIWIPYMEPLGILGILGGSTWSTWFNMVQPRPRFLGWCPLVEPCTWRPVLLQRRRLQVCSWCTSWQLQEIDNQWGHQNGRHDDCWYIGYDWKLY